MATPEADQQSASPEYEAFRKNYAELVATVKNPLGRICDKLFSRGCISTRTKDYIITVVGILDEDKATRMLTDVHDRIKNNPKLFRDFVELLDADEQCTDMAQKLRTAVAEEQHHQQIESTDDQSTDTSMQNKMLQDKITQLQSRLEEKEVALNRKELDIATKEKEIKSLKKQLEQVQQTKTQEIKELRHRLATRDRELDAKERELTALRTMRQKPSFSTNQGQQLEATAQRYSGTIELNWVPDTPQKACTICPGSCAVLIGNKLYFKQITTRGYWQNIEKYDSTNQQWGTIHNNVNIRDFTLANVKNTLTMVGGKTQACSNKLYSYIESKRKWNEVLPPMPTPRSIPGVVSLENKLIVAGGIQGFDKSGNDINLSTVEILDTTNKQWTSASSLPFPTCPLLCSCGDFLYLNTSKYANTANHNYSMLKCSLTALMKSEAGSKVWETMANLTVRHSTLTSVRGQLIAVGGEEFEPTKDVCQYNPTTDSWTVISQLSEARHSCLVGMLPDNKLVVVGGEDCSRTVETATIS